MTELAPNATIIGAGPAGLMAAEILSDAGYAVILYEAMPSPARKFLMAGKSGLNITNRREGENLSSRYPDVAPLLKNALSEFGPASIAEWMLGLGVEATIGPTGRVFPVQMKASPLLRAWLARLQSQGVQLYTRHRWTGWSDNADLIFDTPEGPISVQSDAQIFAMGGGSWKRLGSDGNWSPVFAERGIQTEPFRPSNCGFTVDWSDRMRTEFVGTPVKNVAVRFGDQASREEFVVTDRGVDTGRVAQGSVGLAQLAARLQHFAAVVLFDLIGRFVITRFAGHLAALQLQRDLLRVFLDDLAGPGAIAPVPFHFRAGLVRHAMPS